MAGPRQSNEQLLDRYHSHTKNCSSCSAALKNFNAAQAVLRLLAPVMIAACSLVSAAASTMGVKAVAVSASIVFRSPGDKREGRNGLAPLPCRGCPRSPLLRCWAWSGSPPGLHRPLSSGSSSGI